MKSLRRALLIAAVSLSACRGGCSACSSAARDAFDGGSALAVDTAMVVFDAAPLLDASTALAPARCTAPGTLLPLTPASAVPDLAVGEAVLTPAEIAIGIIRRRPDAAPGHPTKVLSVAVLTPLLDRVAYVDLGTPQGDDPPPRPFVHKRAIWVAWYEHARDAAASRNLVIAPLPKADAKRDTAAALPQAVTIAQGIDESLAFDVTSLGSTALVAWDEDGAKTGVVKVALLGAEGTVATPLASAADSPRLAARPGGGAWLVWITSRPEPAEEAGIEGPGESRAYHWLEAATLDNTGKRVGEVHALTSTSGHVAAFDLLATASGVEVLAREDDEVREGNGAKVLRVTLRESPGVATVLVREGGGGAVDLVGSGERGWATFTDPLEHVRLVPLLLGGSPSSPGYSGLPSAEAAFEGGRILGVASTATALAPGAEPDLLAVTEKGEARFVHCAR